MINKKQVLAGVAGVAAAVSGAAAAQASDLPSKSSPKAPAPSAGDWSGFYAGVSVGTLGGYAPLLDGEGYELSNDATIGGFVGYNIDQGTYVLGAEAAYQGPTNFDYDTDYRINYMADLKLRAGIKISENALLYGLAGISAGTARQYDSSYNYSFWGPNFGAGIDYRVTKQFSIGAEVIARNLTAYDWSSSDNESSGITTQVSLRAAYNF